jgi:hypothetical protein
MNEDIHEAADAIVEEFQPRAAKYQRMQFLLRQGIAKNGKQLRRNALCPCDSGLKFKKCCLRPFKAKVNETVTPYRNAKIERFYPTDENDNRTEPDGSETPESPSEAS